MVNTLASGGASVDQRVSMSATLRRWLQLALCAAAAAAMAMSPAAALSVTPTGPTVDVEGAVAQGKKCCGVANPHLCPGHVPDIPARACARALQKVERLRWECDPGKTSTAQPPRSFWAWPL